MSDRSVTDIVDFDLQKLQITISSFLRQQKGGEESTMLIAKVHFETKEYNACPTKLSFNFFFFFFQFSPSPYRFISCQIFFNVVYLPRTHPNPIDK